MINAHPFGLAPLSLLGTAPDEFVYLVADAGFDFVGLRVVPVTENEPQYDMSVGSPLHKRVTKALADTGLYVQDAEFLLLDGSDQRDLWRTAIERAASFGARSITLAVADSDLGRVADNLAQMAADGAEAGVKPAVEAISYQHVHSIPQAAELAERTGSYFLPDGLHIERFGGTPAQLADAVSRGIVPMFQLCDALPQRPEGREGLVWESRAKRAVPGEGADDTAALVSVLPADLPISVETPDDDFVAAHGAKAWVERLYAAGSALVRTADLAFATV
ncbi:sugar phosphate isomerase/epimerase [Corynebacterium phoceense]|uniref:sugar phosphate isomerase/epimerase family protein n=1 Tax=Corynebacterium phoceense TaxID=1686286 RepID=UPI00211BABE2|nr:sugar phosphate isomerase/epimerase [Corynebacterium phoceense]MCQ9347813.1 sugar phosphate isomerase/epimerase [Corynebacterium phoceense]